MVMRAVDTALGQGLEQGLDWALRVSAWIGWVALGLMMTLGTVDVIGTAFFRRPVLGAFEMAESALAVVMFLGLIHVQARGSHIVVDLAVARLRGTARRLADCLALLGTALALYLVARQTWPLMLDSWRIAEVAGGVFNFPVYPVKTLVCLGASISTLVAAGQFLRAVAALFTDAERRDA